MRPSAIASCDTASAALAASVLTLGVKSDFTFLTKRARTALSGSSRHRHAPAPSDLAFVYDRWAVQQLG